jgi:hypothetical protein
MFSYGFIIIQFEIFPSSPREFSSAHDLELINFQMFGLL